MPDLIDREELLRLLERVDSCGEHSDFAAGMDAAARRCRELVESMPPAGDRG